MEIQQPSPFESAPAGEVAPTVAGQPPGPAPEVDAGLDAGPDAGPDRELVTLEELEGRLAVLEAELARVDAGRGELGEPSVRGAS